MMIFHQVSRLIRSSLLARNIIANMFGRAWMMAMSFAFVPVYIHLLGIEAYGVIGLYATLMILFSVLDLGLSVTLNRELSRMIAVEADHARMRDLVRTLELVYWGIGLCIGLATVAAAPYLARHWLHPTHISVATLELTIRLIGVTAALQWPTGLYGGGIAGLQQFVRSNVIDIIVSTLRGLGGVLVVIAVSRSLEAYFIWQMLATLTGLYLMRRLMWRSLPQLDGRARFDSSMFKALWRFSAGMAFVSLLTILIAQSDKVVLSNAVPLALYAKYLLATAIATASNIALMMIVPTLFPLLSQSLVTKTPAEFANLYDRVCQLITLAVVPVTMTVAAFSYELVLFWTRDAEIAQTAAPLVSILTLGSACTGLFQGPYLLQLSHGSTRISLIANVVSALVIVPMVYLAAHAFGTLGAAVAVASVAMAQIVLVAPFILHKFLPVSGWRWFVNDTAVPMLIAAAVAFGARAAIPVHLSATTGFLAALAAGSMTLAVTTLCLPAVRSIVADYIARQRRHGAAARGADA